MVEVSQIGWKEGLEQGLYPILSSWYSPCYRHVGLAHNQELLCSTHYLGKKINKFQVETWQVGYHECLS